MIELKESMIFKPRARLLLQLGDELIRNESIALLELVKNSYDADATLVSVVMKNVDDKEKGVIVIEDNGIGMDIDTIRNVWMEPGSRYKKDEYVEKKERTKIFGRAVLGEKGIGRFAAHKLGNVIELVSRKSQKKEVSIKIDWTIFEKATYLDETKIEVEERDPQVFTSEKSGTRIEIRTLRNPWTRAMVREVYRAWNSLCSPFDTPESFQIRLDIDKPKWLEGIMDLDQIKEHALYNFKCEMKGEKITLFNYKFKPFTAMKRLRERRITQNDHNVKKLVTMADRKGNRIDLNQHKIGKIKFEGYIFDRDPKILALGVQDKKGFKDYLDNNGGVKVYKDGIRIYDYGEPGNDWLNLDIRRVNVPTVRISNNIMIAAVLLDQQESTDLKEKTNREGFIQNEAYWTFLQAILYALNLIEVQRIVDKNLIRAYYGPSQRTERVVARINELRDTVKRKIKNKDLKDEVIDYLDKIEKDYNEVNETLLRSAGAGLSLSVVIHEVEKIVAEIERVLAVDSSSRVSKLVKHLSELLEGYAVIVRSAGKKQNRVEDLVDQAVFDMEFRLKAHKITVIKDEKAFKKNFTVTCAQNLIISSILNIIDNSIWWFNYAKTENKKIYVTCGEEPKGYTSIVIADNGPGFALPTEEITKPFVTAKPNGMGLGLHIVKEIMEAHGGEIIFPDFGDFSLPQEFRRGAIVALSFKRDVSH